MGIRQSFGLFLQPISQDIELGREVFSLAMALQNLIFGLPLLGMVADRYGPRWVIIGGALLCAAGCLLVPASSGVLDLYLTPGAGDRSQPQQHHLRGFARRRRPGGPA